MRVPRILLACGGTGGHIFPAFSVAEEIKRRFPEAEITYVCGRKDIESEIFGMVRAERVERVESAPWRGAASLLRPSFLIKLGTGFVRSLAILRDARPGVVVGFGGHYSFPVLMAAKLLGIRTIIHEQNVVPGAANRVLARVVDGVALSHEETRPRMKGGRRLRVTGNPIRAAIERDCRREALEAFGFDVSRRTALVIGGSQGAESINAVFIEAIGILTPDERAKLQVLHLCGRMKPQDALAEYRRLGVRAQAYSFFERMDLAYGASDFAVGRAGATFLAEIRAKGIPAVLIPYPFADGHQRENAKAHAAHAKAFVEEQATLTPSRLAARLSDFLKEPPPAARAVPTSSRALLADFILEGAGK